MKVQTTKQPKPIDYDALKLAHPVLQDRIDELREWSQQNNFQLITEVNMLQRQATKIKEYLKGR